MNCRIVRASIFLSTRCCAHTKDYWRYLCHQVAVDSGATDKRDKLLCAGAPAYGARCGFCARVAKPKYQPAQRRYARPAPARLAQVAVRRNLQPYFRRATNMADTFLNSLLDWPPLHKPGFQLLLRGSSPSTNP